MPKREVLKNITLGRGKLVEAPNGEKDGRGKPRMVPEQRIDLTVGQVFDFTAEELRQIEGADPEALSTKTTINLDGDDVDPRQLGDTELKGNQKSGPSAQGATGDGDL